jgi:hypothetical protein
MGLFHIRINQAQMDERIKRGSNVMFRHMTQELLRASEGSQKSGHTSSMDPKVGFGLVTSFEALRVNKGGRDLLSIRSRSTVFYLLPHNRIYSLLHHLLSQSEPSSTTHTSPQCLSHDPTEPSLGPCIRSQALTWTRKML